MSTYPLRGLIALALIVCLCSCTASDPDASFKQRNVDQIEKSLEFRLERDRRAAADLDAYRARIHALQAEIDLGGDASLDVPPVALVARVRALTELNAVSLPTRAQPLRVKLAGTGGS